MKDIGRFSGKIVLITGATVGIGKETARAFAREGATLVLTGRKESEGNALEKEIIAAGGKAYFIKADISDENQIAMLHKKAIEKFDRIDIAFNNAGTKGKLISVANQTVENYREVFDTNVLGVLIGMKYQIANMKKNGGGVIVNTTSISSVVGVPNASVYSASKHAILGLTKTAALENALSNIRINAVSPGGVLTERVKRLQKENETEFIELTNMHPVKRVSQPEEIARVVLFLASDDASFITGQNIIVDGGWTVQ
jgi:NAD(P)-dependent dehydrogenase (short-subunit alcohol dehydrogenase family)